jgi:hypothetical protein
VFRCNKTAKSLLSISTLYLENIKLSQVSYEKATTSFLAYHLPTSKEPAGIPYYDTTIQLLYNLKAT